MLNTSPHISYILSFERAFSLGHGLNRRKLRHVLCLENLMDVPFILFRSLKCDLQNCGATKSNKSAGAYSHKLQ